MVILTQDSFLYTLIYHLGVHLSLRAGQEHRDLEYGDNSQLFLEIMNGQETLRYVERTSKNNKFGLNCSRMEPKTTVIYPNKENPDRCIIAMYKLYVSYRKKIQGLNAFYLTPMQNPKGDKWYKQSPFGIHAIEKVTRELMKTLNNEDLSAFSNNENSKEIFYSNTSLRRSAKQRLINAGVSKEIAQTKTGRISEKADKCYFTAEHYNERMTEILYCNAKPSDQGESLLIPTSSKETPMFENMDAVVYETTKTCESVQEFQGTVTFAPVFNNCSNVTINLKS